MHAAVGMFVAAVAADIASAAALELLTAHHMPPVYLAAVAMFFAAVMAVAAGAAAVVGAVP